MHNECACPVHVDPSDTDRWSLRTLLPKTAIPQSPDSATIYGYQTILLLRPP